MGGVAACFHVVIQPRRGCPLGSGRSACARPAHRVASSADLGVLEPAVGVLGGVAALETDAPGQLVAEAPQNWYSTSTFMNGRTMRHLSRILRTTMT
jgi:hypothetical protein